MPTTTKFIWDEQNYLAEADGTDTINVMYTNEPRDFGNLISTRISSTPSYHHFDALGSTRQLTNVTATVTDSFLYDTWGNISTRTGTTPSMRLWIGAQGYYRDVDTGLFWVSIRPFSPFTGRWTTVDPISLLAREAYIYVDNRVPLTTDPSGLAPVPARDNTWRQSAANAPTGLNDNQVGFGLVLNKIYGTGREETTPPEWGAPPNVVMAFQVWQLNVWLLTTYIADHPGWECNVSQRAGTTLDVAVTPTNPKKVTTPPVIFDDSVGLAVKTGLRPPAPCVAVWAATQVTGFNGAANRMPMTITPARPNQRIPPTDPNWITALQNIRGPFLRTVIKYVFIDKKRCCPSCLSAAEAMVQSLVAAGFKDQQGDVKEFLGVEETVPTERFIGMWPT